MRCAHINPSIAKEQSVKEHLYSVAELAKEFSSKISLAATGELMGMLHDMGKGTRKFDAYIRYCAQNPQDKSLKGQVNHSTAGAKLIYDSFYNTADRLQKFTAQLISLAVCSHHGGLIDCLDLRGRDKYTERMKPDEDILYDEALNYFRSECLETNQLKDLFAKAAEEIKAVITHINQLNSSAGQCWFAYGVLEKYLFSCLIDADRYDTYLFMENKARKEKVNKYALWAELAGILEAKLSSYPQESKINGLRAEISLACRNFARNGSGVYQLAVPTGSGKTLSSLRYALNHAQECDKDRIFYIIPYTTIIDQNAREIKNILGHEEMILEHHSNLIVADDEEEVVNYKLLTERWDSPIILTTMVQFLNTLFNGGTQDVRRLHHLANSVIIFDEIQAIPIKCISMFNSALSFLAGVCQATIILCTATQPLLETTEIPLKLSENPNIISDVYEKFRQFKRVDVIPKLVTGGYSAAALKDFILDRMDQFNSLLVVLNTKNSAREVFNELKAANQGLPEEKQCQVFHLSTNMCPAHRLKALQAMKEQLGCGKVICVSTQLIEAGVNISFECLVRSLAGLDSIAQAAGRCNRHGEKERGDVYIVNLEREDVSKLVDIKKGQECTERVLRDFEDNPESFDRDLLSPQAMARYYKYYFYERRTQMNYNLKGDNRGKSLYEVLAGNKEAAEAFHSRNGRPADLMLKQAFKTAGQEFQAIDENTTGILAPYEEGRDLITLINGECSLGELKRYLKKAQHYSVNLYETDRRKLEQMKGLVWLKDKTILALREGFYDEQMGVNLDRKPLDFCGV
ncbi:CRISPR-associated helicase Cas3 [Desulfofarcimen acetoxidans DSM 771]|uniref:CRISPR-associated helicase Cas3 n=1 Tax=Desulfofarcimen acetoxidans (strain ATCC 49208 / DSM 771 / KCTC 5769 / VKM B-1644 / 5575) TaxID=485916 RepID=C8VWJ7_DESAS|nr:CRISPR-associated helicase/endonuclease Cas3 [Desulfofarcimen acetoxidans]ACV64361.1 CRISPR-associated helicase Cas3 [Desulfofarcimen acetoxidans DSM 771]